MEITSNQIPQNLIDIIEKEEDDFFSEISIQDVNEIQTANPIKDQLKWFRVKDVICVYVDMIGSTKLSATSRQITMARIYKFFTQTVVKIFNNLEAAYIDIKGDGVFALFNKNQQYHAIVAAVHIKTFIEEEFTPNLCKLKSITNDEKSIGAHIGIDQGTLLVRRIGVRSIDGDKDNEVWAGKTVNMAAKLASKSKAHELWVSDRFYKTITSDYVRYSCTCDEPDELWDEIDVSKEKKFDFDKAYILKSKWCAVHGTEYADILLGLDK